jgi:hypothetical protein
MADRTMVFTEDERSELYQALAMRSNFIETSTVFMGAQDVLKCGMENAVRAGAKLRPLSQEQVATIALLRGLMTRLL